VNNGKQTAPAGFQENVGIRLGALIQPQKSQNRTTVVLSRFQQRNYSIQNGRISY
jgi:hypothetical protein